MRLAGRLAGPGDTDDLVQSTMVRALEFDGDIRQRDAWLRRVLQTERWMELRASRRRHAREQAAGAPEPDLDLEQLMHCIEIARIVGELIADLDEPTQSVIRSRFFDDESAAEIARRQGVPAGTVRWRLKTGLDRLREQLDRRYGGRRAMWAGVFAPTIPGAAASELAAAVTTKSAAAKGTKMLAFKAILGLMTVAGAATGLTYALVGSPQPTEATPVEAATPTVASATALVEELAPHGQDAPAPAQAKRLPIDRATWEARRAQIRQAHGRVSGKEDRATIGAGPSTTAEPVVKGMLYNRLVAEVAALTDACEEVIHESEADLSIRATVIGVPEVGSIIDSVSLTGGGDAPEALRECLVETMYTMDLGPTDVPFGLAIQLGLMSATVDGATGLASLTGLEGLDEKARREIADEMAKSGQGGRARVTTLHVVEHTSPE